MFENILVRYEATGKSEFSSNKNEFFIFIIVSQSNPNIIIIIIIMTNGMIFLFSFNILATQTCPQRDVPHN